jgi:hypothetical protein
MFVRVIPEDYERWFATHISYREARREYGIHDGPIYRDEQNPAALLVQLDVEDFDRAMQWSQDARFAEANERGGKVSREMYFGTQSPR